MIKANFQDNLLNLASEYNLNYLDIFLIDYFHVESQQKILIVKKIISMLNVFN
ncbi:ABC transporter related protein [Calothrix sp. PCC 6303]|nr:ABC transporter related protein [Calothrix sp. PCC 6303]